MQVMVKTSEEVARNLHQQSPPTDESQELLKITEELEVSMKQLYPGVDDPVLSTYFTVEVIDRAAAEELINRLLQCSAVEAAYVKPPDELP